MAELTDRLAFIIARWDYDLPAANWQLHVDHTESGAAHHGDCTKHCHTCVVCLTQEVRGRAAELAAELGRESLGQPMNTALRDGTRMLAAVDGVTRIVAWGKTSHVPLYGFCLADQGAEDFDLCDPTEWWPMPTPTAQTSSPAHA